MNDPRAMIPADHLLRLTTFNVLHSSQEVERRTGLMCDELGSIAPVVVCLQEVRFETGSSSRQLDTITAETGLPVVSARGQALLNDGVYGGNAILSSLPVHEAGAMILGTPDFPLNRAQYAVLQTPTGQALIVVSAHLAVGGANEGVRLGQMTVIDHHVRALMDRYADRHPVAILAGDFNAPPGSDTTRYLSGLGAGADGGYTFWTEAFAHVGNPEEATTVAAANPWAQETARGVGIQFPEMLPDRRVDYIWTYGWAYGRPGCPVTMKRSFTDTTRYGFPASDHYGLTVDFWMPPVLAPVPALIAAEAGKLPGLEQAVLV
jgi:endonuclease/exonuclease/phosphatase family metal-dependent hydrolase